MVSEIIAYDIKPTKLVPTLQSLSGFTGIVSFAMERLTPPSRTTPLRKTVGMHSGLLRVDGTNGTLPPRHTRSDDCLVWPRHNTLGHCRLERGTEPRKHTYGIAGNDYEDGSLFVEVNAGDLFVIPAGVTHKSFDPTAPNPDPQCLIGGGPQSIESDDPRRFVGELKVSGFTMMGAYPRGMSWGWAEGGEHIGRYESVWHVRDAELDPVFEKEGGINTFWNRSNVSF